MKHPQAGSFEARARDLYLRAGPRIDPATAAQLRAARRAALESKQRHSMRWMVPTGAVAAALLAVVMVWQPLQHPATVASMAPAAAPADTAQILPPDADQADPALYQNLGFYAWLAQHPSARHSVAKH